MYNIWIIEKNKDLKLTAFLKPRYGLVGTFFFGNCYFMKKVTPLFLYLFFLLNIQKHHLHVNITGTCFIQKIYAPPPLLPYFKVNICPFPLPHFSSIFFTYLWSFRWPNLGLYRYTPEIFLFSTATFKYTYLRRIGQEYSANVARSIFQSLKQIPP